MHAGSYGVWTMVSSWHLDLCCHFFFFCAFGLGREGGTTEGRRCTCTCILNFAPIHHNAGLIVHATTIMCPQNCRRHHSVHGYTGGQWLDLVMRGISSTQRYLPRAHRSVAIRVEEAACMHRIPGSAAQSGA